VILGTRPVFWLAILLGSVYVAGFIYRSRPFGGVFAYTEIRDGKAIASFPSGIS
jgi:hypothetical protein